MLGVENAWHVVWHNNHYWPASRKKTQGSTSGSKTVEDENEMNELIDDLIMAGFPDDHIDGILNNGNENKDKDKVIQDLLKDERMARKLQEEYLQIHKDANLAADLGKKLHWTKRTS